MAKQTEAKAQAQEKQAEQPVQGQPVVNQPANSEAKSRTLAGILGILVGALGIHNFYLGFNNKAIIQLVVSLVGAPLTCGIAPSAMAIWGIVEGIFILTKKPGYDKDANGRDLID